jgi:tetrahydromethanopterin S-methyltransferase subunit A
MRLLRWPKTSVPLSVADEITRANVERAMRVMERHRTWDYRRGYRAGRTDGFLIGFAVAAVVVALGMLLMGAIG